MLKLIINNTDILIGNVLLNEVEGSLMTLTKKTIDLLKYKENKIVDLTFVTDEEIKEINKIYRKKDKATDVISFAFEESEIFPNENLLGEIYISVDRAKEQAKERNQSTEDEIKFLFIHGILHIFGFDHKTDKEEEKMNEVAYKILGRS